MIRLAAQKTSGKAIAATITERKPVSPNVSETFAVKSLTVLVGTVSSEVAPAWAATSNPEITLAAEAA